MYQIPQLYLVTSTVVVEIERLGKCVKFLILAMFNRNETGVRNTIGWICNFERWNCLEEQGK